MSMAHRCAIDWTTTHIYIFADTGLDLSDVKCNARHYCHSAAFSPLCIRWNERGLKREIDRRH